MEHSQSTLPKWILIVSGVFALLELMVSFSLCFDPASVADQADLGAEGIDYLIYMWAARQFALGFVFAFATFRRSAAMLTLAYVFFLVMFAGDLLIGIMQNESMMIIAAIVMCIVSSLMIYFINKRRNPAI